jgi:hypothetical protein
MRTPLLTESEFFGVQLLFSGFSGSGAGRTFEDVGKAGSNFSDLIFCAEGSLFLDKFTRSGGAYIIVTVLSLARLRPAWYFGVGSTSFNLA